MTKKARTKQSAVAVHMNRRPLEPVLCRGAFRCTKCGAPGSTLYQNEKTRRITGFCFEHQPKKTVERRGKTDRVPDLEGQVLYTKAALDVDKSAIAKLVIHKLNLSSPGSYDRRGDIVSLVPKDVANKVYVQAECVEILQYCLMLVGHHYAIHDLGKTGEQSDCWITDSIRPPYGIVLRHKYLGEAQIEALLELLLVLAKVHRWEVEDERQSLLERIAKAAAEPDPSSK